MTEQKEKCKHEWRQNLKSSNGVEPDYLYDDGYYCIHCLEHVYNKKALEFLLKIEEKK